MFLCERGEKTDGEKFIDHFIEQTSHLGAWSAILCLKVGIKRKERVNS